MISFIFLGIGLGCALIGRIILIRAAFGVSMWWGIGVFLPFGPLFFRLSYPGLAYASRMFRLATLPFVFLYFVFGPGVTPSTQFLSKYHRSHVSLPTAGGYALEPLGVKQKPAVPPASSAANSRLLAERINANADEFERLRAWSDKLRLQKRDLLNSNLAGNRAYNLELADYNAARQRANAERNSLIGAN